MINSFVVLDLETTGLSPGKDRILEIGALRVIEGRPQAELKTLVDPQMDIPEQITLLTGITREMTEGQMPAGRAVKELVEFCGDLPLLGHNIMFDYRFVKHQAANMRMDFEKQGIDTLRIARALLPEKESKSLTALCQRYGIDRTSAHRAFDDAQATWELYRILWEAFGEGNEQLFAPRQMIYSVKRQGPITAAQKKYLGDLVQRHGITLDVIPESLTKNEASRLIDKIILQYGRITR